MDQIELNSVRRTTKVETFSKEQIIRRNTVLEFELAQLIKKNYELRNQRISDEQLRFVMAEQLERWRIPFTEKIRAMGIA